MHQVHWFNMSYVISWITNSIMGDSPLPCLVAGGYPECWTIATIFLRQKSADDYQKCRAISSHKKWWTMGFRWVSWCFPLFSQGFPQKVIPTSRSSKIFCRFWWTAAIAAPGLQLVITHSLGWVKTPEKSMCFCIFCTNIEYTWIWYRIICSRRIHLSP